MMKLSKALMLSVSGLIFTSGGSLASIHNLTYLNSPGAITFVHTPYTHTSHSEETLLSSLEKFNKDDLLITIDHPHPELTLRPLPSHRER